jgi:hypothetical protein
MAISDAAGDYSGPAMSCKMACVIGTTAIAKGQLATNICANWATSITVTMYAANSWETSSQGAANQQSWTAYKGSGSRDTRGNHSKLQLPYAFNGDSTLPKVGPRLARMKNSHAA